MQIALRDKRLPNGSSRKKKDKRTYSLFIGNLKVYQESHKISKDVKETIVKISHDTGACYAVAKGAGIVQGFSNLKKDKSVFYYNKS